PALLAEAEVKFHTRNENESLVTPNTTAFNLPWEVIADTEGGSVNRPAGKLTVIVCDPPSGSTFGNATPPPVATRGTPDTEPSLLNVSGPHVPDPSPRTTTFPFVDRNTAGSAFGKLLLAGGWKNATPAGSGVEVTFSATFSRAQSGLDVPR